MFFINAFMAGVAGGAASGKTTVCDMIIQQLHDQRVVLVNQVIFLVYGWCRHQVVRFFCSNMASDAFGILS